MKSLVEGLRPVRELLISLDLEMNQPSRKIIQIGAVLGNVKTGVIVSRFESKVNPGEPLDPRIVDLTKITQCEVDAAPALAEAYVELCRWMAPYEGERVMNPVTWAGGDTETLRGELGLSEERWPFGRRWIDAKTLFIAWRMAQGRATEGGLARSMTKLGLAFSGQKHNARDDAENTFRIYCALVRQFNVSGYLQP